MRVPAAEVEHRDLRPVRLDQEIGRAARQRDEAAGRVRRPPCPTRRVPSHRPSTRAGSAPSRCRARARSSAPASTGSAAYIRPSRATRSAPGSGRTDGAQVSTTAPGPRSTSGTAVDSARPAAAVAAAGAGRASRCRARRAACRRSRAPAGRRSASARGRAGRPRAPAPARRGRTARAAGQRRVQGDTGRRAAAPPPAPGRARRARPRRPGRRRRHRGQPVEPAAQDHEHEARRSAGALRSGAARRSCAQAAERGGAEGLADQAPAGRVEGMGHRGSAARSARQRRWNSGASSSRASACGAVGGALDLASRGRVAERGAEAARGERARVELRAERGRRPGSPIRPRFQTASGPSQSAAAVGPAGGRRRDQDALAERRRCRPSAAARGAVAARRAARIDETTNSSGVFSLRRRRRPGLGRCDQLAVDRGEFAVAVEVGCARVARPAPAAARRRRSGAPAWSRGSARSPGAAARSCSAAAAPAALRDSVGRARSSAPGSCQAGSKRRLAVGAPSRRDRPAGQQRGEGGHVGLGVAAAPRLSAPERVQLQHLARQVLVEAGQARRASCRAAARAARATTASPGRPTARCRGSAASPGGVVAATSSVSNAAGDVRPDRLALEGADQAAHAALGDRDGEVVGPEQRSRSANGRRVATAVVRRERASAGRSRGSGRRSACSAAAPGHVAQRLLAVALGGDQVERPAGVEQAVAARDIGRADLRQQPAARIVADDARAWPRRGRSGGRRWRQRADGRSRPWVSRGAGMAPSVPPSACRRRVRHVKKGCARATARRRNRASQPALAAAGAIATGGYCGLRFDPDRRGRDAGRWHGPPDPTAMLIDFFYTLRAAKLKVSVKEYLTLLEAHPGRRDRPRRSTSSTTSRAPRWSRTRPSSTSSTAPSPPTSRASSCSPTSPRTCRSSGCARRSSSSSAPRRRPRSRRWAGTS